MLLFIDKKNSHDWYKTQVNMKVTNETPFLHILILLILSGQVRDRYVNTYIKLYMFEMVISVILVH